MGRNIGIGFCLALFVALVFGLTIAKVSSGGKLQAFDHVVRPELIPEDSQ